MSRPTDTERGAKMALSMAEAHVNAHFAPGLFSHRLSADELELWLSIMDASELVIADAAALRAARALT